MGLKIIGLVIAPIIAYGLNSGIMNILKNNCFSSLITLAFLPAIIWLNMSVIIAANEQISVAPGEGIGIWLGSVFLLICSIALYILTIVIHTIMRRPRIPKSK